MTTAARRRIQRQIDELAAKEARLSTRRHAADTTTAEHRELVRRERERLERELERIPRCPATLPMFD